MNSAFEAIFARLRGVLPQMFFPHSRLLLQCPVRTNNALQPYMPYVRTRQILSEIFMSRCTSKSKW